MLDGAALLADVDSCATGRPLLGLQPKAGEGLFRVRSSTLTLNPRWQTRARGLLCFLALSYFTLADQS